MTINPHPFDPLSPSEIAKTAHIVRTQHAASTSTILFRVITLQEPPKKEMIAYLTSPTTNPPPKRLAKVHTYIDKTFHELHVDIASGAILSDSILHGRHSHVDAAYMKQVEEACLRDGKVQDALEALKLPQGATVIAEPWTYATDGLSDMSGRITMCWFYMHVSQHPDANYYAYPLELVAEVNETLEVVGIHRLPTGDGVDGTTTPTTDQKKTYDHAKLHTTSEYHPDLCTTPRRSTTRPLHIVQPEGPSFHITGNHIAWENWSMRLGFNYREGMTLHDVRYAGRSLFYRLSLSEMFVPYGDPRFPYPRKGAFDLGNDGAGANANNLKLGCDCLGHIAYFDAWGVTGGGEPVRMPNVVCCHEQDDGILWKHTNFRTGNAVVTRSRVLVLQTIVTVSNYEYVFVFYFGQDAGIQYEVRATGILSTAPIDVGARVPWGTVVAPGVLAPFHQHLFCLRIDPALDGYENSLVVEESKPMAFPDRKNPFGVGYVTESTVVEKETGLDLDHSTNRVFKIVNEGVVNQTTGTPVGFRLMPWYSQPLLAHPSSYHSRRSEFGKHAVWVTRYSDDELYAAGIHTMQSSGDEGIASWIKARQENVEQANVRNQDIVVWHTFGSTHNPRIEDWPVMPCEKMVVGLKPVNFFNANPGLDVPISTQETNKSVLVGEKEPTRVLEEAGKTRL